MRRSLLAFFSGGEGRSQAAGDFFAVLVDEDVSWDSCNFERSVEDIMVGILLVKDGPRLLKGGGPIEGVIFVAVPRNEDHFEVRIRRDFFGIGLS